MSPTEFSRKERSKRRHFVTNSAGRTFADKKLQNQWRSASVWCECINEKFNLGDGIRVNPADLTKAYKVVVGADILVENDLAGNGLSLYHAAYKVTIGEKRADTHFFLVTKGKPPRELRPPTSKNVQDWVDEGAWVCTKRGGTKIGSARVSPEFSLKDPDLMNGPTKKKLKLETSAQDEEQEKDEMQLPRAAWLFDYYESGKARNIFAPTSVYPSDINVRTVIQDRIERLKSVVSKPEGYRDVLADRNEHDTCSEHDKFMIRQRAMFISCALIISQSRLNGEGKGFRQGEGDNLSWKECCQEACNKLNECSVTTFINGETIMRWHRKLSQGGDYFPSRQNKKEDIPRFFVDNPEAHRAFMRYAIANLTELSVELMVEYLHDKLIPAIHKMRQQMLST